MRKEYFDTIMFLSYNSRLLNLTERQRYDFSGLLDIYIQLIHCYLENKPKGLRSCVDNISRQCQQMKGVEINLNIPFHTYHLFSPEMIPYITTI